MKVADKITALRRALPYIDFQNARFMYAKPEERAKRTKRIVIWCVLWSDDGRVSLHRTAFVRKRAMSVAEWAGWLHVNAPDVLKNSVLAYVNRSFGSSWNIERVFGWHLASSRAAAKIK